MPLLTSQEFYCVCCRSVIRRWTTNITLVHFKNGRLALKTICPKTKCPCFKIISEKDAKRFRLNKKKLNKKET